MAAIVGKEDGERRQPDESRGGNRYRDLIRSPQLQPGAYRGTKPVKVLNTNGDEQRASSQWMSQLPLQLLVGAGIPSKRC